MYFVTLRVKDGKCDLGDVTDNRMMLSKVGEIVKECWEEIPAHFEGAMVDTYVIMPNHVHGIIVISKDDAIRRDVQLNVSTNREMIVRHSPSMSERSPRKGTLSVIIRTFKAAVTTRCRREGFPHFAWQSRFYDHIIRDGKDLDRVREYILENPANWLSDKEYPRNIPMDSLHRGVRDWSSLD
jgi:REP element-mobilizing transposase RayT